MKKIYNVIMLLLVVVLVGSNIYLIEKINVIENRVFSLPVHIPGTPSYYSQFSSLETGVTTINREIISFEDGEVEIEFTVDMSYRLPNTKLMVLYGQDGEQFEQVLLNEISPLMYFARLELENKDYTYIIAQIYEEEILTAYYGNLNLSNVGSKLTVSATEKSNGDTEVLFLPSGDANVQRIVVYLEKPILSSQGEQAESLVLYAQEEDNNYVVTISSDMMSALGNEQVELQVHVELETPGYFVSRLYLEEIKTSEVEVYLYKE
jgi:hypothetical protein